MLRGHSPRTMIKHLNLTSMRNSLRARTSLLSILSLVAVVLAGGAGTKWT